MLGLQTLLEVLYTPVGRLLWGLTFYYAKAGMNHFLETVKLLVDRLISQLQSNLFFDAPVLTILLSNPSGRYVLAGILAVLALILLWVALRFVQLLFGGQLGRRNPDLSKTEEAQGKLETKKASDGFKFFKRDGDSDLVTADEALKAIEKEMLDIRQRYVEGHIIPDVYVNETRRLYNKAKSLKI